MTPDPATAFFSVHLQSLQQLAQELATELDGLRAPLDRLSELSQRELPLGSFAEGYTLGAHHLALAGQMYGLLQAVRQAVSFAGQVTHEVSSSYQRFDQQASAAYTALSPSTPSGA